MKKLLLMAMGTAMFATLASATTVTYVVGSCGGFSNSNGGSPVAQGTTISNTGSPWLCPTAASLGITGADTLVGELIAYNSDYSTGQNATVVTTTNWTFTDTSVVTPSTDTTTSTGNNNSNPAGSTANGGGSGVGLNAFVLPGGTLSNGWVSGTGNSVQAGFYAVVSSPYGTPTVTFTNTITTGSVLGATGSASVIYGYTVNSVGTPEPSSLLMMGSALIGLGALKFRKRS